MPPSSRDDALADAFFEERLPGHELKLESVLDHRKAAADVVAASRREIGQAAFSRHLLADPFDL
jgi:hypothetical protein